MEACLYREKGIEIYIYIFHEVTKVEEESAFLVDD